MQALLSQNGRALLTTFAGATAYLGFCSAVGRYKLLPARLARKLMHIGEFGGLSAPPPLPPLPAPASRRHTPYTPLPHPSAGTGPLFMLCWPLYSAAPASRWLAASVPAAAGVAFWAVGSGRMKFDALVAGSSVSLSVGSWVLLMRLGGGEVVKQFFPGWRMKEPA